MTVSSSENGKHCQIFSHHCVLRIVGTLLGFVLGGGTAGWALPPCIKYSLSPSLWRVLYSEHGTWSPPSGDLHVFPTDYGLGSFSRFSFAAGELHLLSQEVKLP